MTVVNLPEAEPIAPNAIPAPPKLAPLEMDARGVYVMHNQSDEARIAQMLMQSGAVNKSLRNATQVITAMQAAKSLGLNPYTALRQIGFINGSLTFYGDLELAVVRMSGQLEAIEEFTFCLNEEGLYEKRCFAHSNAHLPAFGAVCRIKRKGAEVHESIFTEADAKVAGLWQKTPTWKDYPGRMMQMRARGLAIRNTFSDTTQGLSTMEYDHEGVDYGRGKVAQMGHEGVQG